MYTVLKAYPEDKCAGCGLGIVGVKKFFIPHEKGVFCQNCMQDHHIFTVQELYRTGLVHKLPPEVRQ